MKIEYTPIGIVHSPWTAQQDMPIQPTGAAQATGSIEIYPQYQDGLQDLEGFSHLILIYHLHLSRSYDLKVVPFLDPQAHGLFATRSPRRPNPIGLSIVELQGIDENRLTIACLDIVDGTPLLDIKPYVPAFDSPTDVRSGWLTESAEHAVDKRSDRRFVED